MIEAIILDKDGVLVLTEEIYFRAFRDSVKKFGGNKDFIWEHHYQYIGVPTSETFFAIRKEYGLTVNFEEFVGDYRRGYRVIIDREGLAAAPGVVAFLEKLKKEKIPFAIGTGGRRESTKQILERTGLYKYFSIIITADDVAQGKPHPETFLLAAQDLNVRPHNCVVIGDSINDVLGAKSAGMKVIAITDKSYIEDPNLASPDLEVKKFSDITINMIKSL